MMTIRQCQNTSIPESTLNEKSNSIAYNIVREDVARGEWTTRYILSKNNSANTQTKTVPAGAKRNGLVSNYLYDIYDDDDP